MKLVTIGRRARLLAATSLLAAAGLVVSSAGSAPALTVNLKQASITDHANDCGTGSITGGLIVLNQITAATAPGSITVSLSDGSSMAVPLAVVNGGAAKYPFVLASGLSLTGATANVPDAWTGQFVLSHYTCGGGGGGSSSTSTTPTTTRTS